VGLENGKKNHKKKTCGGGGVGTITVEIDPFKGKKKKGEVLPWAVWGFGKQSQGVM